MAFIDGSHFLNLKDERMGNFASVSIKLVKKNRRYSSTTVYSGTNFRYL